MPFYLPKNPYFISANGCWYWDGTRRGGYGLKWCPIEKRMIQASRYMYEKHVGPIPTGMHLDHLCKNRICVNPAHLEPVSNQENAQRGKLAKLDATKVKEIRELFTSKQFNQTQLAIKYNVSQGTIWQIVRGNYWNNV